MTEDKKEVGMVVEFQVQDNGLVMGKLRIRTSKRALIEVDSEPDTAYGYQASAINNPDGTVSSMTIISVNKIRKP